MTTEIDSVSILPHGARAVEEQGGERLTPPPPTHPAVIVAEIRADDSPWPPAWRPNAILDRDPDGGDVFWKTVRQWRRGGHTLAGLGRYQGDFDNEPWYLHLFDQDEDAEGAVYSGFGQTPRQAYRAAYREQRLAAHDTAKLLKERAGLQRQVRDALEKIAGSTTRLIDTRREIDALQGRVTELEAVAALRLQDPLRDKEQAMLTLAYLRAWLTNAPLGEIRRDGLEVLLALAEPWPRRGRAWKGVLLSVARMGIQVGITPQEASRGQ